MADIDKFVYYENGSKKVLKPTDRIVVQSGGLAFEGETDNAFETQLTVTDPTADRTITFPDEDGDVALLQSGAIPNPSSIPVKNPSTTTALTKGQVVYISGHSGNKPEVSLARSDSSSTMPAFGFVTADISAEAEGYITTSGLIKGIATSSFSLGDTLYVSSSTAGAVQSTAPTGTSLIQNIGKIVRVDASNGEIMVGGAGRTNATPNLDEGKFFIGNASDQSVQSNYQLPTSVGTSGQVLTSNGTNVIFGDLDTGSLTVESKTANFTASENYFYLVDTTSGSAITVNLPSPSSVGQRIKIFNHGDGTLTLNDPGTQVGLDPYTDSVPIIYQSSRQVNSRALVELVSTSTTLWEYVIIPQLELDESALTTTGQIFAYNADELAMKALPYTLPTSTGTTDQILKLNSSGGLVFADESRPAYTIQTSSTNVDVTKHYMIPPNNASITLTMPPFTTNAGASFYDNLYFEIVNFSSTSQSLFWGNVRPNTYYRTLVFDSTGQISPSSGSYTYTMNVKSKLGIVVDYRLFNGTHYLEFHIINMA